MQSTRRQIAYISEIFRSVQGEAKYLGKLMVFVRFSGCNLRCEYCDTKRALQKKYGMPFTLDQLAWEIKKITGEAQYVSFTGGEPLLHARAIKLLRPMIPKDLKFFLETNGTLPREIKRIAQVIAAFSIDLKPGKEWAFISSVKEARKNPHADVYAKIVITPHLSIERITKTIFKAGLQEVFFQPMEGFKPEQKWLDQLAASLQKKHIQFYFVPQFHKLFNVR